MNDLTQNGGPVSTYFGSADPTRAHYKVTFAVLATSVMAYALLQSLVTPVLPTIQAGLHTSQNTVTWVLTAYLVSASTGPPQPRFPPGLSHCSSASAKLPRGVGARLASSG